MRCPQNHLFSRAKKKDLLFFLSSDPAQNRPQNPALAGWLFSTRKIRFEVPERGDFGEENCLGKGGVDRAKKRQKGCAKRGGKSQWWGKCRNSLPKSSKLPFSPTPLRNPNFVDRKFCGRFNWLFAIFTRKRSFALVCALLLPFALFCALLRTCVCALLRPFADLRLHSFALNCALLRAFAFFCVRPRLERPRLGTSETLVFLNRAVRFETRVCVFSPPNGHDDS